MEEVSSEQQSFMDVGTRIREMEERQQLLKDRVIMVGKGMVDIREKTSNELRDIRKVIISLQQENIRLIETIQLMTEKVNASARQEELETLKRQIDLLRSSG